MLLNSETLILEIKGSFDSSSNSLFNFSISAFNAFIVLLFILIPLAIEAKFSQELSSISNLPLTKEAEYSPPNTSHKSKLLLIEWVIVSESPISFPNSSTGVLV